MFKVNKLLAVENEQVKISYVTQEHCAYGKTKESFKTLSFEIEGNIEQDSFSFSFDLNCRPEELLKLKMYEKVDMSKYIFSGETFFNYNNCNHLDPEMDIKITRYLKNKFIILINFNSDNDYCGIIEFDFNLDDYLRDE